MPNNDKKQSSSHRKERSDDMPHSHIDAARTHAAKLPATGNYLRQVIHDLNNFLMVLHIRCDQLESFVMDNYGARKQLVLVQENITMISDIVDELSYNEIMLVKDVQMSPQGFFQYLNTQVESLKLICRDVAELYLIDTDRKSALSINHPNFGSHLDSIQPKSARISFHEKLLRRVFMQLLRNVIETAPVENLGLNQPDADGSFPAKLSVTFQLELSDTHLFLHIIDTGPGIHPQHIGNIFHEGFTTKTGENRGIGLSTAKNYVELWHGQLKLIRSTMITETSHTSGTHFRISFPLSYEI